MSAASRIIPNVAPSAARPPQPIDEYLHELDALVAAHDYVALDRVTPAIGAGRATRDVVRRAVMEQYYVGKWTAPEVALLVANAPDVYSFTMDHSTHYRHWAAALAAGTGYLGGASPVQTTIGWCRQLGLADAEVRAYTPLPETIAMTFTLLFHVRRSYEEGVAALGYVGERVGAAARATAMRDGLATHYGIATPATDAPAVEPSFVATGLLAQVALTRPVQDRCREAIRNVLSTAECRVRAMNRWVE